MKIQKQQISQEQQEAIVLLINIAELAQKHGLFNLNDASVIIKSIQDLSPLLPVKE